MAMRWGNRNRCSRAGMRRRHEGGGVRRAVLATILVGGAILTTGLVSAIGADASADVGQAFDDAARLYEQGHYLEAAAAYGQMATNGVTSAAVWFNQGNAWYKAGKPGRAIASYRRALSLAPHDPDIAANLRLVRSKVAAAGGVVEGDDPATRWVALLTAREWAGVAVVGIWAWFAVLAVRQAVPKLRSRTAGVGWALGSVAVVATALAMAAGMREGRETVVVDAVQATVRFGPLREAQSAFGLAEGSELIVTDRKGDWIEVRDAAGRKGWVSRDEIVTAR